MKLTRPDLVGMILAGVCVVGIVVLAVLHLAIPETLTTIALVAVGIGGGTALNTSGVVDTAAARITTALQALEALVSDVRSIGAKSSPAPKSTPAPAPAPVPSSAAAFAAPSIPAPAAPLPSSASVTP